MMVKKITLVVLKTVPITIRKILQNNLSRLQISVYRAIKKRASATTIGKKNGVNLDLENCIFHVLGQHHNCQNTTAR